LVFHVERVLGVDIGRGATQFLRVRHDVQRQRRLAARLGAEDLRHPAARDPTDPDRRVEVDRAGRDPRHAHLRRVGAHPHDGPLPAGFLDLRNGERERLATVVGELGGLLLFSHE